MGCGEFLVKYILFFANLFFALAGLTLIGVGVAVQLKVSAITNLLDSHYEVAPISAIVVGSIVFIIAFFGCCGAIRENNCMLVTYSIFMLVLMLAKIALATTIFVNLDSIVQRVPTWTNDIFKNQPDLFKQIETTFSCCGPTGPLSYDLNVTLPASCCEPDASICSASYAHPGCNKTLEDFVNTFGQVIGYIAIFVAAIELVAVVFGLCLANDVRNKSRRNRY